MKWSKRDEAERRRRRGLVLNPHCNDMSSSRHRCVSEAKRSRLKEIRAACGILTANDMTKDGGAGALSLSQGYGTKEKKPGGEGWGIKSAQCLLLLWLLSEPSSTLGDEFWRIKENGTILHLP